MKKRLASFLTAAAMCFSVLSGIKSVDLTAETEAQAAASYPVQEFRMGISNTNRNINISGTASGSALNSWTTNGADNENWTLNYVSAGVYEIVNAATGYVITNNNGTAVISPDVNGANQRWNITGVQKDFDGYYLYYKITSNADSSKALTFNPDGNTITTSSYSGAAYQKFKLNLTGLEGFAANAKVSEGEKAGTIGGLLGNTVYVDTVSELESALDSTDPLTVVLSANLDMSSAGYSRIRDNKTLVGSYSARQLIDCQLRTNNEYGTAGDEPSDNIVIRNIDFVAKNVEDKILLQIWSSRQIWIDHNTFTSYLNRNADEVGKFIWLNTPYDSYMDAKDNGRSPDYITISYCKFSNRYWTVAYGTQNSETTRCRTTLCYNWWDNCARRCPQIGNGIGHVYNNYYSFSGSGASEQIIVGDGCNMLSENCMFEGLTGHEMIGGGNSSSPFTDSGSYTASSIGGSASKINYKSSYGTSLTPKNHYGYSLLSAYGGNDTKTFCKAYAGCFSNLSSIVYITDSGQNSKPVTVHGAPHLVSIDVTDSGAVADFVDGSSWMIKNVNSGLYIDIEGGKAANGTNAQQWGASSAGTQNTFRLFEAGDGYYYIASAVGDGATYVLDVSGKSSADGANIALYQFNGGDNQKFKFTENADGSYKIRSKVSGDKSGIEIVNAETGAGANVQQWTINGHACQDWILEPATNFGCSMDTSVIYEFENVNSGMVMDIPGGNMADGENVQQWSTGHFTCQQWTLKAFSGGGNYYYIHSVADPSFVLIAHDGGDGGNVGIAAYSTNNSSMLFKFAKNLDGTYTILTRNSKDACLVEVGYASTASGANVQQWSPTEASCQDWNAVTFTTTTTTTTTVKTTTTTVKTTTTTTTSAVKATTTTTNKTTAATTTTAKPVTTSTTTTTTAAPIEYPVVKTDVAGAESVDITLSGTASAGFNGVVGYWDNSASEWVEVPFEGTFDENGKYEFNVELPSEANAAEIQVQIYWSGVWDNDLQKVVDVEADIESIIVNLAPVTTTTTTTTTKATTTTSKTTTTTKATTTTSRTTTTTKATTTTSKTTTTTKATTTTSKTTTTTKATTTTSKTTTTTKATTTTSKTTTTTKATTTSKTTTTTKATTTVPVTTTTTVTTPAPTTEAFEVIFGDADCNGDVQIADVVKIMTHLTTPGGLLDDHGIANADVYQRGDGISNMDALSIQKSIAQLIASLPESFMD